MDLKCNLVSSKPPKSKKGIRLGLAQMECPVGTPDAVIENIKRLKKVVKVAKKEGTQLLSFPELYISGYALDKKLVRDLAEPINGKVMRGIARTAKRNRIALVVPYPERDSSSGKDIYYDSIALFGSGGKLLDNYRKTHLFGAAEKLNFSPGAGEFNVVEINGFPLGVLNCYEAEFPELSRILALKGAKLILIPTAADMFYTLASGETAHVPYPDVSLSLIPARALENHCFVAYCNRCGTETVRKKSWEFRGNSIICAPNGTVSIAAAHKRETLIIADCVPGTYEPTHPEGNYISDRRPEFYKMLVDVAKAL